jgi:hypothetical protein
MLQRFFTSLGLSAVLALALLAVGVLGQAQAAAA